MVTQIVLYDCEFTQSGQTTHLSISFFTLNVAWINQNNMRDESYPKPLVMTVGTTVLAGVFDNQQRKNCKLWLDTGKASLMQQDTKVLMRKKETF
jgi:hypothetical protein